MLKNTFRIINRLIEVNVFKTLYFNFKYFPIKQAIRLPCLVCYHTSLSEMKGHIIFNCKPKSGTLRLGFKGLIDCKYSSTIWKVRGDLYINGKTCLGRGCKLYIEKYASLHLGNNFDIAGNSSVICSKNITFGDNCLLSWDILIMDSDFHSVLDRTGNKINPSLPINIGNHVWIGCRSTILKGISIPNDCVIAASSVLTKSFHNDGIIIGGSGSQQRILKENITWCK